LRVEGLDHARRVAALALDVPRGLALDVLVVPRVHLPRASYLRRIDLRGANLVT